MSTISLFYKPGAKKGVERTTQPEKLSSKHECGKIVGITGVLFGIVLVLFFMGPIMIVPDGSTEDKLACTHKIIGYQQHGYYSSPDQFKLALSYCG
ncbi:MAG TPA: hypothetical protein VH415_14095 [Nitrososphaeraceae archaeon]|jgi:hypothetical protein